MNKTGELKKLVIFDMDDTLHEAEDHVMEETWNALLKLWGRVWKEKIPSGLIPVQEHERPGLGIRPLEFLKHFIRTYNLDPRVIDIQTLRELDISENDLNAVAADWDFMHDEERIDKLARVLETTRKKIPEQIVKEFGTREIPGAVDMMRRFKESDYGVAIVSSGSFEYALNVMESLGLLHTNTEGEPEADYDLIISGDMVEKSKPDPEPHNLALEVMEAVYKNQFELVAMFGDSNSDAMLALNAKIPEVFIRNSEYLPEGKKAQMREKLGDRVTFVDHWATVKPENLRDYTRTPEGGIVITDSEQIYPTVGGPERLS